jgi:hypothetical protein
MAREIARAQQVIGETTGEIARFFRARRDCVIRSSSRR